MKARIFAVLASLLLLGTIVFCQQIDSTVHVKSFPGTNVGQMVTNAMASCPAAPIPCILVIDPSLAAYSPGTLPTLCGNCTLADYRSGVSWPNLPGVVSDGASGLNVSGTVSSGAGKTKIGVSGVTFPDSTVQGSAALADPGGNGLVKRTALDATAPAVAGTDYAAPNATLTINSTTCALAGSCNVSTPGVTPKGAYSNVATYSSGDLVSSGGSIYICETGCSGVTPVNGANWLLWPGPSTTVANTWTALQTFSQPVPANTQGYTNFNGLGSASTTALNAGVTVFSGAGTAWGMDFGRSGSHWQTRLFAPTGNGIAACFFTSGTLPTAQSGFTCPWEVTDTSLTTTLAPQFKIAASPANTQAYTNVNGSSVASTTNLNPGVVFFASTGKGYGVDMGYYNSKFITRRFAPSDSYIGDCWHTSGTQPTAQSSFTNCTILESATAITMDVPLNLNVGTPANPSSYLDVNSGNLTNSTSLNPGVALFSGSQAYYGLDLGFENGTYATRIAAPDNQSVDICSHVHGSLPAQQSDFTCYARFQPTGITFNVPFSAPSQNYQDPQTAGQSTNLGWASGLIADHATPGKSVQFPTWTSGSYFGDSITLGTGSSAGGVACSNNTGTCYIDAINAATGIHGTSYAYGGDQAADLVIKVFNDENAGAAAGHYSTIDIGTNDAHVFHAGAHEPLYETCHLAAITFAAVQSTFKVAASGASTTGTWTTDTTYSKITGLQSTTNASTAAIAITTYGYPIYLWYRIIDGNGGTFTYSVDGRPAVALNAFGATTISTVNGATQAVALARITNLAPGSHTVTITVTSSTSVSNVVSILGLGTPAPNHYYAGPTVVVGGIIYEQNDALSLDTQTYNADALADTQLLQSDGLDVRWANVRTAMHLGSNTEMFDIYHPNDTGHAEMALPFIAALQSPPGRLVNRGTPASSSAGCTSGETWGDGSYVYNCVKSGQIVRAALSSF